MGADRSGESSTEIPPAAMSAISSRIEIIASQKRSSSPRSSLSGFDHQRSRDWERHRRCVESVVDESFGDVVNGYAGLLVISRRSRMHSCATRPCVAVYSTG